MNVNIRRRSFGAFNSKRGGVLRSDRLILLCTALLVPAAIMFIARPAHAQVINGTILGTVKDLSGAFVPGATITATNTGTSFSRKTITDASGNYTVPLLPIGSYTVTADAHGFKKTIRTGVSLRLGEQARIDLVLSVGSVQTTVTVQGNAPVLDTDTSARTLSIGSNEMVALPLLGRDWTSLVELTPGVTDFSTEQSNTYTVGFPNMANYSFSGIDNFENSYYVDGIDSTDIFFGQIVFNPSIDAIQEFSVESNQYDAEYGGGGGVVSAAFKSGTNQLHGDGYEFFRNSALDARSFFSPVRSPYEFNQFGGVLGGPVVIPHVYNGRDRTFFMVNYEGQRLHSPTDSLSLVPTAAERNGDFSALGYQLYNPVNLDPATGERLPFANNQIPSSLDNKYVPELLSYMPLPNMPLNVDNQNYFESLTDISNTDQFNARVDHRISDKWETFGRFSWASQTNFDPENYPGYGGNAPSVHTDQAVLGFTGTLSPTLVNEIRLGYTRNDDILSTPIPVGEDYDKTLGFPFASTLPPQFEGMPTISFLTSEISGLGSSSLSTYGPDNTAQFNDTLTWVKGNHTFKTGVAWERPTMAGQYATLPSFLFNGGYTALYANGQEATPGFDFADFLLGYPQSVAFDTVLPGVGYIPWEVYFTDIDGFLQDDWKITPRLTINIGLRYDYNAPATEEHDRATLGVSPQGLVEYAAGLKIPNSDLVPDFPTPGVNGTSGQIIPAGQYFERLNTNQLWGPDTTDFQPRFGVAYRLSNKTVIRASYGIFRSPHFGQVVSSPESAPFLGFAQTEADTTIPPTQSLGILPPSSYTTAGVFDQYSISRNFPDPFMQNWTFGVERALTANTKLEVAYTGSHSYYLFEEPNINLEQVPGDSTGNKMGCGNDCPISQPFPFLYPWLGRVFSYNSGADSDYDALQVNAVHRASNGLTFQGSFDWEGAWDDDDVPFVEGQNPDGIPENPYNMKAEWARSEFAPEKRVSGAWVYDLPFGPQERFSSRSRAVNALIGGWTTSGLLELQSGLPFQINQEGDTSGTGETRERVNRICNGNLAPGQRSLTNWFNRSCFVLPQLNTFANEARDDLWGPGLTSFDVAVLRQFKVREGQHLEFRAEFYNVLNHPSFMISYGNEYLGSGTYDDITATSTNARIIQFALKYTF
jgi:Carboxypeptidase regulatory-like domain/TonB dependent receptor